ncbi:MAG: hypothetical protein D3921_13810 [Candidatus Electrothrix sp. AW1]|nr:hypothetical protein [Candidatus Electrothrix sp. AX1]MCI5183569.1 hypothetical protein [Candidatus Electrothrix gigas]
MKVKEKNVPVLRFPGFEGEWVNALLEDISQRGSGHTPSKNHADYYNGGIKWVSLADSSKLDNGFIEDTEIEISEEGPRQTHDFFNKFGKILSPRDRAEVRWPICVMNSIKSVGKVAWLSIS